MDTPKRAFVIKMEVHGDTLKDATALLEHFTGEIAKGLTDCVTGGCGCGGFFKVSVNPEMTPEKYVAALEEYRNRN